MPANNSALLDLFKQLHVLKQALDSFAGDLVFEEAVAVTRDSLPRRQEKGIE